MDGKGSRISLRKKLLFACLPVLLLLLSAEVALRVWAPPWTVFENRVPTVYERHEEWGYRYGPNSEGVLRRYREIEQPIRIGREGWRGDLPPKAKPAGVFRVVLVGDSHVAGLEVAEEETLGARLEEALQALSPERTVQVVSLGLDGSGTDIQRKILEEEGLGWRPDLVVLQVFRNDFRDAGRPLVYREVHEDWVLTWQRPAQREALLREARARQRSWLRALARWSYLGRGIRFLRRGDVPDNFLRASSWYEERAEWEPLEERVELVVGEIAAMRESARRHGAGFAVASLPAAWVLDARSAPERPSYSAAHLRAPLEQLGIPLLDLRKTVLEADGEPALLFHRTDSHPNAQGYRVMAEALARWIATSNAQEASWNRSVPLR